jgi:hypothetical protein
MKRQDSDSEEECQDQELREYRHNNMLEDLREQLKDEE